MNSYAGILTISIFQNSTLKKIREQNSYIRSFRIRENMWWTLS